MPVPLWFLSRGLVNSPGYGQDFNAEEAIWGWARGDAMGNLCLGSREAVPEKVRSFLNGLASRTRRSETTLPDGSAIKVRGTPARLQARFPAAVKCTSHFGFGLVLKEAGLRAGLFGMAWPLWCASSFPAQAGMVSLTMVPWRCWVFRSSGSASPYVVSRPDPD